MPCINFYPFLMNIREAIDHSQKKMRWNDFKHVKMFAIYMCALDIILVICCFRGYFEIMKLYIYQYHFIWFQFLPN